MNDVWNSRERLFAFLLTAAGIHGAMLFTVRVDTPQGSMSAIVSVLDVALEVERSPAQVVGKDLVPRPVVPSVDPAASATGSSATPRPSASSVSVTAPPANAATLVPAAAASANASLQQASVDTVPASPATPVVGPGKAGRLPTQTEGRADPTRADDRSSAELGAGDTAAPGSNGSTADESPEPARLTAAMLGRQITEWTAEYTQAQTREGDLPSRTARVEKVQAHHRYAADAYERAWQDKVERVGNLNYPEEARRKNLAGGLLLSVGVNADGTLQTITVHRSSGHQELDDAAVRIVRLAAPFSPFPSQLKNDYDVLVITRTWRFFTDHRLTTSP